MHCIFFLLSPHPPRSTLFPYTTLFRSWLEAKDIGQEETLAEVAERAGLAREELLAGETGSLRSEEHTSELQSRRDLVCRLLLEKKKKSVQDEINTTLYDTTTGTALPVA